MAWWLQLTHRSVQRLDMIGFSGTPTLLAVWQQRDRVRFYRLHTGDFIGETAWTFPPEDEDRTSEAWTAFLAALSAPNKAFLPVVQTPSLTIHTVPDGQTRLFQIPTGLILKPADQPEAALEVKAGSEIRWISLHDLMIAGLDRKGKLHLYRQQQRLGTYDIGIKLKPESWADLALTPTGIYVADSGQIVQVNLIGKVTRQLKTAYWIARMTLSPNGHYLITSDLETGVLRIYDGSTLSLTHQRFAIDLLIRADKIQLLAETPPAAMALNALAIDDQGTVAFAISGVICVAQLDEFERVSMDSADTSGSSEVGPV